MAATKVETLTQPRDSLPNVYTSVTAREVDFVTRFGDNWEALRNILGITRPIRKTPGTSLVSYTASIDLESGSVDPGEVIPYSKTTIVQATKSDLTIEKYAKAVPIEDVNKYGAEIAVEKSDDAFLTKLQNVVMGKFYTFLNTGSLTKTAATWQDALAKAQGEVLNKFATIQKDVTQVVGFANILDAYDYLGTANISVQTQFGINYIKDFMGYSTLFLLPALLAGQSVYIHFDGADYRAVVTVNDTFVGEHEGFFSPFEFEITGIVKDGTNRLKVELYNDHIYMGNDPGGSEETEGDKLYAATGLGWDGPLDGWHHCPSGTGIYNRVYVEIRNSVHISDLYIRPLDGKAEAWLEIQNDRYDTLPVELSLSLYGQNFPETVFEDHRFTPETTRFVGMGDSLTEAAVKSELGKGIPMPLKHGKNLYKLKFDLPDAKLWDLETPYLYQLHAAVLVNGTCTDRLAQQFGMRSFTQDTESPQRKGMFYLNGRSIRLRGANTMGFEQQDVLRGDLPQLIDDILLAKLCNMNFLRLTQRPVQDEVYEYCDKLGLMTQTDLPLFGVMRRFRVPEGIRQAEEMARMVRKHPCNIVVSYINEPFPNANNEPHRHLTRPELENFFTCCDLVVKLSNPDQVIKHVDGDYDPPTDGMPDNHCYPMWYNGHGIDIGRLHRGYWLPVKPGWYYGCGEYGAEGLDSAEVMEECYPREWLREPFDPGHIVRSQTKSFSGFFYDAQEDMQGWISRSQRYQAFAARMMTEAFRRDDRMVSNAIHLFIDAWPSGWMKSIMDCKRIPKQAYFAYRDALAPLLVSLRTDRFAYTAGETIQIEAFLCNDTAKSGAYTLAFELYNEQNKLIQTGRIPAHADACRAVYIASAEFPAETAQDRETLTLRAVLLDGNGDVVNDTEQKLTVFQDVTVVPNDNVVILKLEPGLHTVAGETVTVKPCGMLPLHFVSRKTEHPAVDEFKEQDFSYWYDAKEDCITPLLDTTFTAEGFTPILLSNNMDEQGNWGPVLAAAEKLYEGKHYVICQLDLRQENPVAKRFLRNLYRLGTK